MLPWWIKRFIFHVQNLLLGLLWVYSTAMGIFKIKKAVPAPTETLLHHSATNLARLIRQKRVTSEEVVEAYIRRIKEVNPVINSVVEDRFEQAMEEARRVDRTIRDGDHPPEYWESEKPLFGIPVTIKESLAVKGMSHNVGMPGGWLESVGLDRKAAEDAEAVANLRASGAVPILVSATPQLCLFLETFNSVQGTSCNPFDSSRTPGGSSGGEGALVGSAASLAGLGTDIIGSIRVPAFFCGVFGHKPSPGIISVKGHRPTCRDEDWDKYLTAGPLCRYAEDLPLILKAVAPKATQILKLDQPVDIRKIRVFFMEEDDGPMTHRVDEEIKISIRKAVEHLSKVCEVQPQEIKFREFHDTLEAVFTLMLRMKSPTNIFQKSSDPEDWTTMDVLKTLVTGCVGWSGHTMYAVFFGLLHRLAALIPERHAQAARRFKSAWQNKFQDILGDDGVFLLPTLPRLANIHRLQYGHMTDSSYLAAFNLLEMPSTACPMGLSAKYGLPTGLQVAACKYQDRLTLAIARELESAFGGWVHPPYGSHQILPNGALKH